MAVARGGFVGGKLVEREKQLGALTKQPVAEITSRLYRRSRGFLYINAQ